MEHDPQTRKEKKGSKRESKNTIYTSRRVRQMEALIETKGLKAVPVKGKKKKKE